MDERVTEQEVMAMLQEIANAIRAGKTKSVSIRFMVEDGTEYAHTFSLETQEERDVALASILKLMGQLH